MTVVWDILLDNSLTQSVKDVAATQLKGATVCLAVTMAGSSKSPISDPYLESKVSQLRYDFPESDVTNALTPQKNLFLALNRPFINFLFPH